MKNKECKVTYVEELEADYKVNCAEIKLVKYKIYGRTNEGWQLIAIKTDKQKARDFAKNIDTKNYNGKIIIEHNEKDNTDFPIEL